MNNWTVYFQCRKIGAIGIWITKSWTVQAENGKQAVELARAEGYKTHEHLAVHGCIGPDSKPLEGLDTK